LLFLFQHEYILKYHASNFKSVTDTARLAWHPNSNHLMPIGFTNIQYMVESK